MCVYTYIYIYIYMYMCICACTCIYIYIYIHTYIRNKQLTDGTGRGVSELLAGVPCLKGTRCRIECGAGRGLVRCKLT